MPPRAPRRQIEQLLEAAGESAHDESDPDSDHGEPDHDEQCDPSRCREEDRTQGLRGRLRIGVAAHGVDERHAGDHEVGEGDAEELDALAPLLGLGRIGGEERARDLPYRQGDQTGRDEDEQQSSDRVLADLLHRTVLVGVARGAGGDGDRDRPDDDVDQAEDDESGTGDPPECGGPFGDARHVFDRAHR